MGINNDEINHGVFHGTNQKFALLTEESTVIQWRELEEAYYFTSPSTSSPSSLPCLSLSA